MSRFAILAVTLAGCLAPGLGPAGEVLSPDAYITEVPDQGLLAEVAQEVSGDATTLPTGDLADAVEAHLEVVVGDPGTPPQEYTLTFETEIGDDGKPCLPAFGCGVTMKYGDSPRALHVVLAQGSLPVAGSMIKFDITDDSGAAGALVPAAPATVYSSGQGVAAVLLKVVKPGAAQFTVVACSVLYPEVPCIDFRVTVTG